MAQILIVEGNDAIALAAICKAKGLKPPKGYESPQKFKNEFVKSAGGYEKAIGLLKLAIEKSDYTNIGIILDANDKGVQARWQSIRSILLEKYSNIAIESADQPSGFKIIEEIGLPTIGVWIMPNNAGSGYFEHFIGDLVPKNDELWRFAEDTLNHLKAQTFNEISEPKTMKALLHSWLAWKEEPGKPFGQAVISNYFNLNAPNIAPFLQWFEKTFVLSQ